MYAEERQHEIVTRAREIGRVSVAELAARFAVTPETVRRDLDALATRGLLSRVHGGAVPADRLRLPESSVQVRQVAHPEAKEAIAARAVAMLPQRPGLTVLIDAGTTTARACALLPTWVDVVVTNSVPAAAALSERTDLEIHLLGGTLRGLTQAAVGVHAQSALQRMRVDVALLGANGFSTDHGFSTPDPAEAAVKRAMVGCATEVFVLADASKHDADYLVSFAGFDEVDALVTDAALASSARQSLAEAGLRIAPA